MKAELISTGSELLLGQILNTNAQYLAEKLAGLGVDLLFQSTVGDNESIIREAIKIALKRADLIIITGGLGPTTDDLTREAVANAMNLELYAEEKALDSIKEFFRLRGRQMSESNKKQALLPIGAKLIPNYKGTAPGFMIDKNEKIIVAMPGPPMEMKYMYNESVEPFLKERIGSGLGVIVSRMLKVVGIGESAVEEHIIDLVEQHKNPTIAFLALDGEVTVKITAKAGNYTKAKKLIADPEKEIRKRIGRYIYGADEDTLEKVVVDLLIGKGLTVATAESCTGGLIAKRLTDVPGASKIFMNGIVSYSNEAKMKLLGVAKQTLDNFGAVSEETAIEMAKGARQINDTDLAISITGIAGPGGGSPEKPVGLVYIGFADRVNITAYKFLFSGDREAIRRQTANAALNIVRRYLLQ